MPLPSTPELVGPQGVNVPGWHDVRLLAPSAELRVAVAGYSRLMDVQRIGCVSLLLLQRVYAAVAR